MFVKIKHKLINKIFMSMEVVMEDTWELLWEQDIHNILNQQ